jgi:epoxyqueuosine reductase
VIAQRPWQPEVDGELLRLFAAEELTLLGVAPATPAPARTAEYRRWLDEGRHGTMTFLETHAAAKYHPQEILPGCRSIILVGINYYQRPPERGGVAGSGAGATTSAAGGGGSRGSGSAGGGAARGRVARYAWGRDYHKELGKRLKRIVAELRRRYPDEQFRPFTDATPLAERHYAEAGAIGFTGRHTLLINGELGSWFVIGEILSTREWAASEGANGRHGGCPRSCRKCIDVCPTGALLGPERIDASRCISYLTIEHDGVIDEELRPLMGDWVFGCDLCQEVCPLNVRARPTAVEGFLRPIAGSSLDLGEILAIEDDDQFLARFAGSPLMRAKRRRLLRNACIAAANSGARELLLLLEERVNDADEIIAIHAEWAVRRLRQDD